MPIEKEPDEPEDDRESETEKPRFLLPEGCKDLVDVLRLQLEREQAALEPFVTGRSPSEDLSKVVPKTVSLPDPVSVRDLAAALRLKPFHILGSLLDFNVFTTLNGLIEFSVAQVVCARYGVVAKRAE